MTFDNRITELIAIGASGAANCQSCLEYHLAKAAEYGMDRNELTLAVEIGRRVRKGAAAKVNQAVEGLLHKDASAASAARSGETPVSEVRCCASGFKGALPSDPGEVPTGFRNRCTPFSAMAAAWSGGFPFGDQDEAKP